MATIKAKEPFRFCTRLHLSELTGLKAATLSQLVRLIEEVPDSCIYHHTHRFLLQHQYFSPGPSNDFAYWAAEVLGEDLLGEKLLSVDTVSYSSIKDLREKILETIRRYLEANPLAKLKFSPTGEEFHFIKSVSFIIPTGYLVYGLEEFVAVLKKISFDAIYFHIFEARLRLERKTNDFSYWFEASLGDKPLAEEVSRFDPYTYTLEEFRKKIIEVIERRINRHCYGKN